ncbi:PKD domain-containing protein [Dyadobacter aurulentus]|uniref:PKD domain-containing protein n=1 Tax=Dyadobacter sp. UC 10 TaxID=2605428 RepID=UPI0011F1D19F|nr:PKD domain-containing protein [Dyadobacter sp. UC 10]KAA0989242.1 PKD domain-containing protein [Dyadobacter sp. UC 10]
MRRILIQLLLLVSVVSCHMELPPQPVAKFTVSNDGCTAPCLVTFTSTSENAKSFEWDFNVAGEPLGVGATVTYKYMKGKRYAVKLIAKGKDGGSSGATQMVEVKPEPASLPEADFEYTLSDDGIAPSTVTFDNQSGNAVTYKWDFGDPNATSANPNTSTDQNPKHTYSAHGKYTVTLTAYNADGKSDTQQYTIEVKAEGPNANFTMDKTECEAPCEVSFTNGSINADTYSWDFGDNSGANNETSPKHSYNVPGTYTVVLTATGAGGSDKQTMTVTIRVKSVSAIQIKSEYNFPTDIVSDASGNIYVCGSTMGTTIFGNGITGSAGYISSRNTDFYVAKYSPSGECLWGNVYGSAGDDHASGITLDNASNVYVTGYVGGAPRITGFNFRGDRDGFVMKVNTNGGSGWFKSFGGPGNDRGRNLGFFQTSDGPRIYVTGIVTGDGRQSNIYFDTQQRSADGQDFFLVFYDTENGAVGQPAIGGGAGSQSVESMVIDDEGSAYLVGSFESSIQLNGSRSSFGQSDMFVVKWDKSFSTWLGLVNVGYEANDYGYDIVLDKDKNIYITGMTESTSSSGVFDILVTKLVDSRSGSIRPTWSQFGFGSGNDYAGGIEINTNGNLLVAGSFSGRGGYPRLDNAPFESEGSTDAIICELNKENGESTGNFKVRAGGKGEDRATRICVAPDGTVYNVGWFQGTAAFNGVELVNNGIMPNTYIAKYKY